MSSQGPLELEVPLMHNLVCTSLLSSQVFLEVSLAYMYVLILQGIEQWHGYSDDFYELVLPPEDSAAADR